MSGVDYGERLGLKIAKQDHWNQEINAAMQNRIKKNKGITKFVLLNSKKDRICEGCSEQSQAMDGHVCARANSGFMRESL